MNHPFRIASNGIYRCVAFEQFLWQKHGFGTREANPVADVTLRQIHSNRVWNVNGMKDRESEGDALITDAIGKSIGIRTADCVPILLLDCRNRTIAAVHAGWRGTAAEIAKRTIERMRDDFHTDPADLHAALGPCIRDCCYEVGSDVAQHFAPSAGKSKLDLPKANRLQLQAAGVNPDRIFDCGLCTACQSAQFFSYRREPENPGRMVASICRLA